MNHARVTSPVTFGTFTMRCLQLLFGREHSVAQVCVVAADGRGFTASDCSNASLLAVVDVVGSSIVVCRPCLEGIIDGDPAVISTGHAQLCTGEVAGVDSPSEGSAS